MSEVISDLMNTIDELNIKNDDLKEENAELREAICIHVREHMDCGGIDNDDEAVIYFKNTFNEKNYN
jgi:hypothetical protein